MTDMLKTVYPLKLCFAGGIIMRFECFDIKERDWLKPPNTEELGGLTGWPKQSNKNGMVA